MVMGLPFLRNAAVLQSHLFDAELAEIDTSLINTQSELDSLRQYLNVNRNQNCSADETSIISCLWWPMNSSTKVIKLWCQELANFSTKSIFLAQVRLYFPD